MAKRKISDETAAHAAELYAAGGAPVDICRDLKVTKSVLYKTLVRLGVARRSHSAQRKFHDARRCPRKGCGTMHTRAHAYCAECFRRYMSEKHRENERDRGRPPAPPVGFNDRDLTTGRPVS